MNDEQSPPSYCSSVTVLRRRLVFVALDVSVEPFRQAINRAVETINEAFPIVEEEANVEVVWPNYPYTNQTPRNSRRNRMPANRTRFPRPV